MSWLKAHKYGICGGGDGGEGGWVQNAWYYIPGLHQTCQYLHSHFLTLRYWQWCYYSLIGIWLDLHCVLPACWSVEYWKLERNRGEGGKEGGRERGREGGGREGGREETQCMHTYLHAKFLVKCVSNSYVMYIHISCLCVICLVCIICVLFVCFPPSFIFLCAIHM